MADTGTCDAELFATRGLSLERADAWCPIYSILTLISTPRPNPKPTQPISLSLTLTPTLPLSRRVFSSSCALACGGGSPTSPARPSPGCVGARTHGVRGYP